MFLKQSKDIVSFIRDLLTNKKLYAGTPASMFLCCTDLQSVKVLHLYGPYNRCCSVIRNDEEKIARLRLSCDSYCTITDSTKLNNYCMLLYLTESTNTTIGCIMYCMHYALHALCITCILYCSRCALQQFCIAAIVHCSLYAL